jgi:pimeloyl-ACP methyl ester carboxylesterase
MFSEQVEAGARRGLRHVTYSRPGYGGSDRHPGRSVADCAADVAAIVDALGIERFFIAGISGGGPHALACTALLGHRVIAAATLGSVAPYDAEGLEWLDGMGQENLDEFGAASAGEDALVAYLEPAREELLVVTGEQLHAAFGALVSEPDRRALTGAFAEFLADNVRNGLAAGVNGWLDDDFAFVRDWGFALDAIRTPVTVWQGAQDRFVPAAHGEWLAAHVPGANARLEPEHGHLSLELTAYGDVLDALLAEGA